MKKRIIFLMVFFVMICLFLNLGCEKKEAVFTIKNNEELSTVILVDSKDIDFTKYFKILDEKGSEIEVKNEYLDLSEVDTSKEGSFSVNLTYKNYTNSLTFLVVSEEKPTDIEKFTITVNETLPFTFEIGTKDIDFTKYFSIKNSKNEKIEVKKEYLDLSKVNFDEVGEFDITLTYDNTSLVIKFNVLDKETFDYMAKFKEVIDKYINDDYDNYTIKLKYEYDDGYVIDEDMISYCDNSAKSLYYDEEPILCYYFTIDDEFYCYYIDGDDEGYYYANDFDTFIQDIALYLDYSKLYDYTYDYVNGWYVAKEPIEKIYDFDCLLDYSVSCLGLKVLIEDDKITKIEYKISYEVDNSIEQCNIILDYIDYGLVDFSSEIEEVREIVLEDLSNNKENIYSSTFQDKNLKVLKDEFEFESNIPSHAYSNKHGVQFLCADGEVVLTSKDSISTDNVEITCDTNAKKGFDLQVKIGDTYLTCDANNKYHVNQTKPTIITFKSDVMLEGKITVIMTPLQDNRSMFISKLVFIPSNEITMEKQYYEKETLDKRTVEEINKELFEVTFMPLSGSYDVLVIPVQFTDYTFTKEKLDDLYIAFNGTPEQTGFHSVSSFYFESSFGKLDMKFDIMDPFTLSHEYDYYRYDEQYGEDLLLETVLGYDDKIDYNKYDANKDGIIDCVYLVYAGPTDYIEDSNYWGYTSWYLNAPALSEKVDDLDICTYMFAGIDFIYSDVDTEKGFLYCERIPGLKINATTYIHETGHCLGLDDYYDYDASIGDNMSMGNTCMMDGAFGDQDPYSKLILGWIEPNKIITETQEVTIEQYEKNGDHIIVPLNFNNSIYSEYLIIYLYTNEGMYEKFNETDFYKIFGGEEYGICIQYVNSEINYDFEIFPSFTKYNNSYTDKCLTWIVEADGELRFKSNKGYSTGDDLWQAGDKLSDVYPDFARLDGKLVNFDIEIVSVSATEAKVKIVYNYAK